MSDVQGMMVRTEAESVSRREERLADSERGQVGGEAGWTWR